MRRAKFLVLIGVLATVISVQGQTFFERLTKPNSIGGGLVLTHQDALGGMSAVGPGFDLYAEYQLTPQWYMAFGTGLYSIMDNTLSSDNFTTTLFPSFELRGGYRFNTGQKFMPFVQGGLHLFWDKTTVQTPSYTTDTQFDSDVFIGAGAEISMNEKLSLRVGGDYRYVFSADVSPKPKFWVAKAGISYSLNTTATPHSSEEIEYPVGHDELALDDLFKEDKGTQTGTEKMASAESNSSLDDLFPDSTAGNAVKNGKGADESDALSLLFSDQGSAKTEEKTSEVSEKVSENPSYSTSEISDLMNKVQNLKSEMTQKNQQIENLQTQVSSNEKALAELSGRLGGGAGGSVSGSFGVSNDSEFKSTYENALHAFSSRKYKEAIQTFKNLMSTAPDNRLASNCEYWIGESYNQLGDYESAIQAFHSVLKYKTSYKFDDALLMSGLCSLKLGDRTSAKENFQELVSRYPDSEYAPKAMRYLGSL
jgi:tol-pal system protein YbgF